MRPPLTPPLSVDGDFPSEDHEYGWKTTHPNKPFSYLSPTSPKDSIHAYHSSFFNTDSQEFNCSECLFEIGSHFFQTGAESGGEMLSQGHELQQSSGESSPTSKTSNWSGSRSFDLKKENDEDGCGDREQEWRRNPADLDQSMEPRPRRWACHFQKIDPKGEYRCSLESLGYATIVHLKYVQYQAFTLIHSSFNLVRNG